MTEALKIEDTQDIYNPGAGTAEFQYDNNPGEYQEATMRTLREMTHNPFFEKMLGNLDGKNVLDVACGDGIICRVARKLGAKKVVGIDISKNLIEKAIEQEKDVDQTEHIEYHVADMANLNLNEKFDVVTGALAIHYSPTREVLHATLDNAKKHLNEGGIFYASFPNPVRMEGSNEYGVKMTPKGIGGEGDEVQVSLSSIEQDKNNSKFKSKKEYIKFSNYFWTKETYMQAFKEAGFDVEWIPIEVSDEGRNKYGDRAWEEYDKWPVYVMVKATLRKKE
jgi:ubiquinone/menaquinone biosynthesis C-methylase UbiE